MKHFLFFGALTFAIGLVAVLIFGTSYAEQLAMIPVEEREVEHENAITSVMFEALARQDSATAAIRSSFELVEGLKASEESELRRYLNAEHLEKAKALGVGRVSGARDIAVHQSQGRLVGLYDSEYYYVKDLTVSVPYVTPDVIVLLDEIGERFHAELRKRNMPLYRFGISSVLRTEKSQEQLRKLNSNAAAGVSTHEYGTTLDIVYHEYAYHSTDEDRLPPTEFDEVNEQVDQKRIEDYDALGKKHWEELRGILGRVLLDLQNEGDVMVIYERQQPVFHITVGRRLFS